MALPARSLARGTRDPTTGPQDGHIRQSRTIAIDTAGTLYVADTGNNMIRKIATDGT